MAIQHTNVTVIRYVDVMIANPHPARFLVTVSVNNFIMDKKKLNKIHSQVENSLNSDKDLKLQ